MVIRGIATTASRPSSKCPSMVIIRPSFCSPSLWNQTPKYHLGLAHLGFNPDTPQHSFCFFREFFALHFTAQLTARLTVSPRDKYRQGFLSLSFCSRASLSALLHTDCNVITESNGRAHIFSSLSFYLFLRLRCKINYATTTVSDIFDIVAPASLLHVAHIVSLIIIHFLRQQRNCRFHGWYCYGNFGDHRETIDPVKREMLLQLVALHDGDEVCLYESEVTKPLAPC